MYAGRVAEKAPVRPLFHAPRHPYTRGLIRSIPTPDLPAKSPLPIIEGVVPELHEMPPGCRFSSRCGAADARCRSEVPALDLPAPGEAVACHHWRSFGA
jgi:oligopeptide/dipeptide ABC transporter ATP-binding protein